MENQGLKKRQYVEKIVAFDDFVLLADERKDHTGDPVMYISLENSLPLYVDEEYSPDLQDFLAAVNRGEFSDCALLSVRLEDDHG